MPSTSPEQRRFMAAAANNPEFARKAGIAQSVAREFHEADKAKAMNGKHKKMAKLLMGKK